MFFQKLSQMIAPLSGVNLTVYSQNGELTVSVFPKVTGLKDEAQNHLQPVVIRGIAEDIDADFFDIIYQPLQKATSMLIDMKRFEESLAVVEAEKKEAQMQKQKTDKAAQERRDKYEKLIARADEQETDGKHDNALQSLREARTVADGDNIAKTDARIEKVKAKCLQASIF
jgi:PRTRC genetic system protein E